VSFYHRSDDQTNTIFAKQGEDPIIQLYQVTTYLKKQVFNDYNLNCAKKDAIKFRFIKLQAFWNS
jgi:hypothetical protein